MNTLPTNAPEDGQPISASAEDAAQDRGTDRAGILLLLLGAGLIGSAAYLSASGSSLEVALVAGVGLVLLLLGVARVALARVERRLHAFGESRLACIETAVAAGAWSQERLLADRFEMLGVQLEGDFCRLRVAHGEGVATIAAARDATLDALTACGRETRAELKTLGTDVAGAREALQSQVTKANDDAGATLTGALSKLRRVIAGSIEQGREQQAESAQHTLDRLDVVEQNLDGVQQALTGGLAEVTDRQNESNRTLRLSIRDDAGELFRDLAGASNEAELAAARLVEFEEAQRDLGREITELRTGLLGKLDHMGTLEALEELGKSQELHAEALNEIRVGLETFRGASGEQEVVLSAEQIAPVLEAALAKLSAKLLYRLDSLGATAQIREFRKIKKDLLRSVAELRADVLKDLREIGSAREILDVGDGMLVLQKCLLDLGADLSAQLERIEAPAEVSHDA